MKKNPTTPTTSAHRANRPLKAWGERRPEPDWDRFIAAMVALALKRVEEADGKEDRE